MPHATTDIAAEFGPDFRDELDRLFALRCAECGMPSAAGYPEVPEPVERLDPPRCERCGGLVRPGVVWFGEMPLEMNVIEEALEACGHRGRVQTRPPCAG